MSQEDLVKQVVEICHTDDDTARSYLQLFNWNLNDAVENILSAHNEMDADFSPALYDQTVSASNSTPAVQPAPARSSGTNIATFSSLAHQSPEDSDSDDRGQAFYVGGAEHGGGGQQVLGPPREGNSDDIVRDIFRAAREGGAETLDVNRVADLPPDERGHAAFSGIGHRLGESLSDPAVRVSTKLPQSPSSSAAGSGNRPQSFVLKMWQGGFSVDDGPFRSFFAPDSAEFLKAIKQGRIPPELVLAAGTQDVQLSLEDHHNEAYQEPTPPKVKVFSGAGRVLGNPTPRLLVESTSQPAAVPSAAAAAGGPQLNESSPITQIQVRLPDGSRLLVKLNHEHTVQDLRAAIISQRPDLSSQSFELLTTFPRRELTDPSQSLSSANLLNAAVVVNTK